MHGKPLRNGVGLEITSITAARRKVRYIQYINPVQSFAVEMANSTLIADNGDCIIYGYVYSVCVCVCMGLSDLNQKIARNYW